MSVEDGSPGSREVAVRVFAAEYDDTELSYSQSDEERAPNYVVTPTGARINRLFVVGVLTEVEPVNEEMLRARVVDPTGAFIVYAGQYQPEALAFLDSIDPPAFVAVTGKARTFEPDDGDRVYTSVRPESISEVTGDTRDRWAVQTAEHTLDRVATMARAQAAGIPPEDLEAALRNDGVRPELSAGIPRAIEYYGTTPAYLDAVRALAIQVLEVVAGSREEVEPFEAVPTREGDQRADDLTDVGTSAEARSLESTARSEPDAADISPARDEETGRAPATTASGSTSSSTPETDVSDGPDPDGFELDDGERQELEEAYGTDFASGTEVEEPGEADIEPEVPQPGGDDRPADGGDETPESSTTAPEDESSESKPDDHGDGDTGSVDLEEAVMATMREYDDGDGADRTAIVDAIVDEHGVGTEAVEDAVQEALMSGRCYEPDEGRLKAI